MCILAVGRPQGCQRALSASVIAHVGTATIVVVVVDVGDARSGGAGIDRILARIRN